MAVTGRRAPFLGALLLALVIAAAPVLAQAQAPTSAPAGNEATAAARKQFDKGEAEYRQRDFKAALGHYKAALKLVRRLSLIFNIAQCYRQLKDPENAIFYYKLYLADWGRKHPNTHPPDAAEVQAHIVDLTAELKAREERRRHAQLEQARRAGSRRTAPATGRLRVAGLIVPRAEILVDGVGRTITPTAGAIEVRSGRHRVRIDAPGHRPLSRQVEVKAGGEVTVLADLVPLPQRRRRTAWLVSSIVSLALAGGAEAAAIVFTLRANERFEGTPPYEEDRRWVIAGHATAGALAAFSATSLILYLLGGESGPPPGAAAAITPRPDGAAASVTFAF